MGPTTRPIRDDRPLASKLPERERRGHEENHQNKQPKPDYAEPEAELTEAVVRVLPERWQLLARILTRCTWCIAFLFLLFLISVDGHRINIPGVVANTASAEEQAKLVEQVKANTKDLDTMKEITRDIRVDQIVAMLVSLQQSICRGAPIDLTQDVLRQQRAYARLNNNQSYPLPECVPAKPTLN